MRVFRIEAGDCETPRDVLEAAIESGLRQVLIERDALPASFFDLSSGTAGSLVQSLVNYGIRAAVVVPDVARHSDAFQAFVTEANNGRSFRFFESVVAAEAWLRDG